MLIEKELELKLSGEFSLMPELSSCQIVGSRLGHEETGATSVVAIAAGMRSHDAFSLPMITMPVTVSIVTRAELDSSAEQHEKAVEAVVGKLETWHKDGAAMSEALDSDAFSAGELKLDGGPSLVFDKDGAVFQDSIGFSIRGTERFNNRT